MKKVTKRIISVCVSSVVLVAAAATVTFTWFSYQQNVQATNINIGTSNYAYQLKIALAEDENFVYDIKKNYKGETFTQMSGDGVNFYMGEFETFPEEGRPYGEKIGHIKLEENQYYRHFFYQEILLKADKDLKIYMKADSYINPVNLSERKEGNISKDYVAAAMRMSIAQYDEENECYVPFIVWAPNSNVEYISGSTPEIDPEGDVEEKYQIVYGTGLNDVLDITTDYKSIGSKSISFIPGLTYVWGNFVDDIYLFNILSTTKKLAVGVWLEGSDRECVSQLSGGKVNVSLQFTAEPLK